MINYNNLTSNYNIMIVATGKLICPGHLQRHGFIYFL